MDASSGKDWRELCAEAADEPDSEKVVSLVNQILQAFDECDQKLTSPQRQAGTPN
jgi:glucose-6-phosphate dehydrogenase assembly protein OpcA